MDIMLKTMSGPLSGLHIAQVGTVDGETYGSPNLMESIVAGGARIDEKKFAYGVVHNP